MLRTYYVPPGDIFYFQSFSQSFERAKLIFVLQPRK